MSSLKGWGVRSTPKEIAVCQRLTSQGLQCAYAADLLTTVSRVDVSVSAQWEIKLSTQRCMNLKHT